MPKVTVLPHPGICPNGAEFEVPEGANLAKGFDSLEPAEDDEEDLLDQAWGLKSNSRLTCQTKVGKEDITVEIPKYSRNHAREND